MDTSQLKVSQRLVYKFQVPGQPVTPEVGSKAQKWPNPVYADNLAADGATAKN